MSINPHTPKTLVEKIWAEHLVAEQTDGSNLLHVDRVFLDETAYKATVPGLVVPWVGQHPTRGRVTWSGQDIHRIRL